MASESLPLLCLCGSYAADPDEAFFLLTHFQHSVKTYGSSPRFIQYYMH